MPLSIATQVHNCFSFNILTMSDIFLFQIICFRTHRFGFQFFKLLFNVLNLFDRRREWGGREGKRHKGRERRRKREGEKQAICWFTPQMPTTSWSLETPSGCLTLVGGAWARTCCCWRFLLTGVGVGSANGAWTQVVLYGIRCLHSMSTPGQTPGRFVFGMPLCGIGACVCVCMRWREVRERGRERERILIFL